MSNNQRNHSICCKVNYEVNTVSSSVTCTKSVNCYYDQKQQPRQGKNNQLSAPYNKCNYLMSRIYHLLLHLWPCPWALPAIFPVMQYWKLDIDHEWSYKPTCISFQYCQMHLLRSGNILYTELLDGQAKDKCLKKVSIWRLWLITKKRYAIISYLIHMHSSSNGKWNYQRIYYWNSLLAFTNRWRWMPRQRKVNIAMFVSVNVNLHLSYGLHCMTLSHWGRLRCSSYWGTQGQWQIHSLALDKPWTRPWAVTGKQQLLEILALPEIVKLVVSPRLKPFITSYDQWIRKNINDVQFIITRYYR